MPLARRQARSSALRSAVAAGTTLLIASPDRLGHGDDAVYLRARQYLPRPGGPRDHHSIDPLACAEAEVQASVVLAREAGAAVDDPSLREIAGLEEHLGADRAPIAPRSDELEADPVVRRVRHVAIQHRG